MKKISTLSLSDLSKMDKNSIVEILDENKSFLRTIFGFDLALTFLAPFLLSFCELLGRLSDKDFSYFLTLKEELLKSISPGENGKIFIFSIFAFFLLFTICFGVYFTIRLRTWFINRKDILFSEKVSTLQIRLKELEQKELDESNRINEESKNLIKKLKDELKEKNISETAFWFEFKKLYF